MSYLDQFLKETNSTIQQQQQMNTYDNLPVQNMLYKVGSIESEEGDIEDNRALSITSSKSNLSELSTVSKKLTLRPILQKFFIRPNYDVIKKEVLQGSVLGSLLYIFYINTIENITNNDKVMFYVNTIIIFSI